MLGFDERAGRRFVRRDPVLVGTSDVQLHLLTGPWIPGLAPMLGRAKAMLPHQPVEVRSSAPKV